MLCASARTSIIPGLLLFLLACNAYARNVIYTDDSTSLEPIMTQSRRTRICTELCASGLGGTPCGDSCFDLIPTNLPIAGRDTDTQNDNNGNSGSSDKYNATTREDSCDVLCKNKLGYPLCACTYGETTPYAPDFMEVCSTFCVNYNYQISGCQNCEIYQQFVNNNSEVIMFQTSSLDITGGSTGKVLTIGWSTWCKKRCSNGNGGAACNCDLLP